MQAMTTPESPGTVPEDLMTIPKAAEEYGVSQPTIRYWVRERKIRSWKLRGFWVYVSRAEVERMTRIEPSES